VGARGWLILGVAVAAVLLLVGRTATSLFVDHAWFEAMGAPSLFWEQVIDTALLQGGAWAAGSLFAFANLHAVRRTILAVAMPSRVANLELTAMVPGRRLLSATIILAVIVGGVLALPLTNWETLALVRHGVPFGEIEGIFDRDLGHYVYWLPFEETMYLWSLVSVVALTAMVLVLYALTRSLRLEGRRIAASTHVRRHLSVLGALVLLLLAWSYRLDAFDLLLAGSGPDGLFLRVDHRVTLRMDYVLSYGSTIAALIIFRSGWTGQLRVAFVTLTLVLVAAVGLRHAVPAVLARGNTLGEPARRDADYIAARALYSRRAYDVDAIRNTAIDSTTRSLLPTATTTLAARASLWDAPSLAEGLGRGAALGGGRTSSDRAGTDATDGQSAEGAPLVDVSAPTWVLANGRVSALRVARPVASAGQWRVSLVDATQPVVRDSVVSLPGYDDDGNGGGPWPLVAPGIGGARLVDATTAGDVPGAMLDTPQSRIAHAWALRDIALLGADSAVSAPLLVTYRDVRERVQRLTPIFEQGTTVHALRDGGALYWVLHLYSASDRYPFSQRWQIGDGVFTYYKLAATAIVDASTGRVRLVPAGKPDALARTWMTRLPRLFTPASALPSSLAAQLPPASDGASLQLRTFARYGSRLDGPVIRHLPDSAFFSGPPAPVFLESGSSTRPAWSIPLLDDHDGVAGVATVTGSADGATYWTPAPPAIFTWPLVLGRIRAAVDSALAPMDSSSGSSRLAAMPDAGRSNGAATEGRSEGRVRLGRPEALVTSRGILVVQAARGIRADGRLDFRLVAVSDGQRIGLGPTLADALTSLGETVERPGSVPGGPRLPGTNTNVDRDAPVRWYEAMRQAMKQGNWSAFGAAFDSLGRALGRPPQ
jgi:uncharacterized protein